VFEGDSLEKFNLARTRMYIRYSIGEESVAA